MSEGKVTPGPWRETFTRSGEIVGADGSKVGELYKVADVEVVKHLPDLLQAVRGLLDTYDVDGDYVDGGWKALHSIDWDAVEELARVFGKVTGEGKYVSMGEPAEDRKRWGVR